MHDDIADGDFNWCNIGLIVKMQLQLKCISHELLSYEIKIKVVESRLT